MRFRFLSQHPDFVSVGRAGRMSTVLAGAALGAQGLLAGPLHAAPTIGGDDNGPQVRILQPSYQDVLKGKTGILIAVSAAKFNPELVEILVDDKVVLPPTALTAFPSARFDWDTKAFVDGPHKLTVRVTDTQGFRGWAEVVVYINNQKVVDTTPPTLSWLNVKPYQQISGTAKIQLQALDNFGVKWIIVAVNPENAPTQKPPLRSWMLNRPPYIINFDTTTLPDGIYNLSAQGWDFREQEGTAPNLKIGIANNPINLTTPAESLDAIRRYENAASRTAAASATAGDSQRATRATGGNEAAASTNSGSSYAAPAASGSANSAATNTAVARNTQELPSNGAGSASAATPAAVATSNQNVAGKAPVSRGTAGETSPHLDRTMVARATAPEIPAAGNEGLISNGVSRPATRVNTPTFLSPSSAGQPARNTRLAPAAPEIAARALPDIPDPRLGAPAATAPAAPAQARVPAPPRVARVEVPVAPPALSASPKVTIGEGTGRAAVERPTLDNQRVAARYEAPAAQARALPSTGSAQLSAGVNRVHTATASPRVAVSMNSERVASLRSAVPAGLAREVNSADRALLSGTPVVGASLTEAARQDALKVQAETVFTVPGRTSAPEAEGRVYLGTPVLSLRSGDSASRIAQPVQIENAGSTLFTAPPAVAKAPEGATRPVPALIARAQAAVAKAGPLFSGTRSGEMVAAGRTAPGLPQAERAQPSRTTTPQVLAEKPVPSRPLLSRLPGQLGRTQSHDITPAITVAPLQVEAARTLPAFHVAERGSTVKAIAARYGLPEAVVAACNNLKSGDVLMAGTRVNLPRELQVSYKGEVLKGDVSSLLVGSTSVTGFRFLWEKQGGKLEWDAKNKRVVARNGERQMVISVGSKLAKVDDKEVLMDLAAFLMSGRTMVPVRLFEEGLNAQVEWEPETGRMYVAMANTH